MLKKMLLLLPAALPLVAPSSAWAAFETIELVGLSRGWGYNCDQPLSPSYLVAGTPSVVAVNPVDGHCWYGADWVQCCDGYNWYIELSDWVIVAFPPLSEPTSWCGPCEPPGEFADVDRCEDYSMDAFLVHADADYRRAAPLAVNPADGSVWVAEPGQLLHLNSRPFPMCRRTSGPTSTSSAALQTTSSEATSTGHITPRYQSPATTWPSTSAARSTCRSCSSMGAARTI